MAPRKMRIVADLVRGRTVSDALTILKFTPNRSAAMIGKVVSSAAANAENVHGMDREILRIHRIMIDEAGPTLKRFQPVSRGMAHPILKRLSHITVEVAEDEGLAAAKQAREETRKQRRRGVSGRGRGRAAAPSAEGAETTPSPSEEKPKPRARRSAPKAAAPDVEPPAAPKKRGRPKSAPADKSTKSDEA